MLHSKLLKTVNFSEKFPMKIISITALLFCLNTFAQNSLFIPDTLVGSSINLTLQEGNVNFFPGQATETMGANGNLLGPTLILNRNQNVTLNVTNNLMDTSTIHWHGLHVAPENDGGPHTVILPGQTWSPNFQVLDWASTYWYHPHLHMHTNMHVQKGIAGLIIVRDNEEEAIDLPRKYGIDDIPMVIQTKAFDANNQIVIESALDTTLMVNGTIDPFVNVPEQIVRFRLLNGSSERVYNFGLSNNQAFFQIASDGGLLTSPVSMTRLRLAPGERAEILVNFTGLLGQPIQLVSYGSELPAAIYGATQPGMMAGQVIPNYSLNPLNGNDFQIIDFNVISATINPVTIIPTTLINHTPWLEANADITRALTFTPLNMGPTALQGPFLINSQPFDMMTINQFVPFESTEIWTLTNSSPIAHPFHIHDIQFYILDINGVVPPVNQQGRKDVVLVPAGSGVVRFITKFEDFHNDTLPYMYHCHMLPHEDDGMMGQFIVNSPTGGIESLIESENALIYPNPTTDILNIKNPEMVQSIKIYDCKGKFIIQMPTEQSLNIHFLEDGIYFIELSFDDDKKILRFLKN